MNNKEGITPFHLIITEVEEALGINFDEVEHTYQEEEEKDE